MIILNPSRFKVEPTQNTDIFALNVETRAVASLTVPGGQSSTFLIFSSNFDKFFLFFLKLYLFSSSYWLSGWASRPPGKALATQLVETYFHYASRKTLCYFTLNGCAENHRKCKSATISLQRGDSLSMSSVVLSPEPEPSAHHSNSAGKRRGCRLWCPKFQSKAHFHIDIFCRKIISGLPTLPH